MSAAEVALWRGFLAWTEDVTRQVEQELVRGTGLSAPDIQILLRISEAGGELLQRELQAGLGWTATRLSHQLTRMEGRAYLVRSSAGAGRSVQLELTAEGAAVLSRATGPHAAAVRRHFLDGLSGQQRQALLELIARDAAARP